MKKFVTLLSLLVLLCTACTNWSTTLDGMQQQLNKLKGDASLMNSQAEAVTAIVNALHQNASATDITPIKEGSKTVGFTLTFNAKDVVTVYNQPSAVTFTQKNGKYYWTVDGNILKDASGNELEIAGNAVTPQFKVDGSSIKYSLDGGSQWLSAGDDLIASQPVSLITEDENNVYINLASGEKISIAKNVDLKVTLQGTGAEIGPGQTVQVAYSVEGLADSLAVSTMENEGWIVRVEKTGLSTGVISVTAPVAIEGTEVLALFSDGRGRAVVGDLGLVAGAAEIIYPEPFEKDFPIMAWYSLTPEFATRERFQDLADAGFTISLTQSYNWETDAYLASEKALLDVAEEVGVKVMVEMANWTVYSPYYGNDPYTLEEFVAELKDHPALYGYQILDEPTRQWLPQVAEIKRRIKAVDSVHPAYINLLPDWETPGYPSFQEYVADAYMQCDFDFFSFDKYPIHTTFVDPLWYMNLEVIRNFSINTGRPFWAFALSCGPGDANYPVPSVETIRLAQYTNLAYGAQGLEYFTYQDAILEVENSNAPVDRYGNKTPIYDIVKKVNLEIQNRSYIFKGCNVKWVRHTSETAYCTTLAQSDYPECLTYFKASANAMVSYIENNGCEYLMVVNKNHLKTLDIKIDFNKDVYMVGTDGAQRLLKDVKNADSFNLFTIDKGDTMIFRIK